MWPSLATSVRGRPPGRAARADGVLAYLRLQKAASPAAPTLQEDLAYLEKRVAQRQSPTFQTDGWPISSGAVESANQQVIEARLEGAGMQWGRTNVNLMVAVRNAVCGGRSRFLAAPCWSARWSGALAVGAGVLLGRFSGSMILPGEPNPLRVPPRTGRSCGSPAVIRSEHAK
jgi:hypothetical protein